MDVSPVRHVDLVCRGIWCSVGGEDGGAWREDLTAEGGHVPHVTTADKVRRRHRHSEVAVSTAASGQSRITKENKISSSRTGVIIDPPEDISNKLEPGQKQENNDGSIFKTGMLKAINLDRFQQNVLRQVKTFLFELDQVDTEEHLVRRVVDEFNTWDLVLHKDVATKAASLIAHILRSGMELEFKVRFLMRITILVFLAFNLFGVENTSSRADLIVEREYQMKLYGSIIEAINAAIHPLLNERDTIKPLPQRHDGATSALDTAAVALPLEENSNDERNFALEAEHIRKSHFEELCSNTLRLRDLFGMSCVDVADLSFVTKPDMLCVNVADLSFATKLDEVFQRVLSWPEKRFMEKDTLNKWASVLGHIMHGPLPKRMRERLCLQHVFTVRVTLGLFASRGRTREDITMATTIIYMGFKAT